MKRLLPAMIARDSVAPRPVSRFSMWIEQPGSHPLPTRVAGDGKQLDAAGRLQFLARRRPAGQANQALALPDRRIQVRLKVRVVQDAVLQNGRRERQIRNLALAQRRRLGQVPSLQGAACPGSS